MTDYEQFSTYLRQWDSRRRLAALLLWLPRGVLGGLLLAAIIAAIARFRPLLTNAEVAYAAMGLALFGLLLSLGAVLTVRWTLAQQARFADRQFGLQERASTAVEVQSGRLQTSPLLAQQQLADTLDAVRRVDARVGLPLRLDRRDWLVLLLAVALLVAAALLPNPQSEIVMAQRALAREIESQIEALEALSEEVREDPALSPEAQEALSQPLEEALAQLQEGELSREETVAVLSEAEAELRALSAEFDNGELRQRLAEAGQPLAENPAAQSLGGALQNGDLAAAGAAAAQLADSLTGMTAEEQAALAQDLRETASALAEVDGELAAELAEAAEALANGETAAAQQALQEAGATLQGRAQELAAAQAAADAAGQLNQGRQAVAQAGQTGQGDGASQQSAQAGEQGSGQGQGQGDGQTPGEGQGIGQQGGQGEGQAATNGVGPDLGSDDAESGQGESVFVPDPVDLSSADGPQVELPAECRANPADCGPLLSQSPTQFDDQESAIPYEQVFGDYRDAAYEALEEEYIPLGLRDTVRDYFSSLEPVDSNE